MIMKHLKIKMMSIAFMAVTTSSMAQSLNKMNWLNEPQQWEIKDGKTLVMDVPAKTDFWRISHYGFTVDDGPFYYAGKNLNQKKNQPATMSPPLTKWD